MGRTSRRLLLAGAALAAAALPSTAAGALTATGVTIAGTPAYDQVVVAFSGGRLSGFERQVDAPDPSPGDGVATVRVNARGIRAVAATATRAGVTARLVRRPGSVLVRLRTPVGRSKFVSYDVSGSRTRLVVRLWRATTASAARRLDDGCLRMTRWSGRGGGRARGLELQPLFEHALVLSLRRAGAGGRAVAQRPVTAIEGTFRPDFSGYARPGRWSGRLNVAATPPVGGRPSMLAMLEARSESAKDGSLECLVQTPVLVRP